MEKTDLTPEKLEALKRDSFVAGYVQACREWTSGCVPAVTLAFRAYEKVKKS